MLRFVLPLLVLAATPAWSASQKGTQFWNLTGVTLKDVRLAPAGTRKWGPNQCRNDDDGEVDFDERLPVTGTPPGRYDVRMRDTRGRTCTARGVEVKEGEIFVIHQRDLPGCPWQ